MRKTTWGKTKMPHKLLRVQGMKKEDKKKLYEMIKEIIDGKIKPKNVTWGDNRTLIIDYE